MCERDVKIAEDADGKRVVVIQDILFKGKRSVDWQEVEEYLKSFIGKLYTKTLKGTVAKAKANAVQGLPELIEIATEREFEENKKRKHSRNAKNGWYRYKTKFALPVMSESGKIERYNIFTAKLLVRCAIDGKKYLYDVMEIKKETSKSCQI